MNYTEEEKKAIEDLKNLKIGIETLNNILINLGDNENIDDIDIIAIDIIINLLEKQQKEIEELKKINNLSIEYIAKEPIIKGCSIDPIDLTEDNNRLQMQIKDSIPKEIIREKIKELEKYIYTGKNAPQDFLQYRVKAKIQGYKELLGE